MSEHNSGGLGVTRSIAPLYQRLPRGPHQLAPTEVARHQRLRMHGAMVEAVAVNGYANTSVKQIIGLAGVSRRAFYEQFANKEECFLATFDLIAARGVKRVHEAYRSTGGDLERRIRAAVGEFTDEIESNAKGAGLAIVQAQTAGAPGLARLRKAMGTFEQMLSSSFAHAGDAGPLPAPIVRGIVGGMHEATAVRLRAGRPEEIPALSEEIAQWTLLFQTTAGERLSERLATRARTSSLARAHKRRLGGSNGRWSGAGSTLDAWMPPGLRAISPNRAGDPLAAPRSDEELRKRLRSSVLNLAVVDDYHELSAPQIAEEAGIPIESFFELFASKEECFLAAFDDLGDELLGIAADPDLVSGDWAGTVRRVVGELLALLAARPLYAHIIASEAPSACPEALERDCDLAHGIATLLTEGAPEPARNKLAVEGVAGAIWHTIRCQVTSGQIHLLPALSDYLAYTVLAPFIGADAAAEVVIEDESTLTAGASVAG
ncbi:MAG TPA: TetR/AcrR family transcriptional regulator [Solirubrobacteraceae bacterium]|jgi:AcrR family transcriptional regulator|nr:TetR/AcrR family transcriptional regulator [Solirubrobacteraceae bacterium]